MENCSEKWKETIEQRDGIFIGYYFELSHQSITSFFYLKSFIELLLREKDPNTESFLVRI